MFVFIVNNRDEDYHLFSFNVISILFDYFVAVIISPSVDLTDFFFSEKGQNMRKCLNENLFGSVSLLSPSDSELAHWSSLNL